MVTSFQVRDRMSVQFEQHFPSGIRYWIMLFSGCGDPAIAAAQGRTKHRPSSSRAEQSGPDGPMNRFER
jgi:hypothetical protein